MQDCLGELNLNYCLIYKDDVVVYSWNIESHLYCLIKCLTDSENINISWKWSLPSAPFSRTKSPTWHMSCPLRSSCHHLPIFRKSWRPLLPRTTPRFMSSLEWPIITADSSRTSPSLVNHCRSTPRGKVPSKRSKWSNSHQKPSKPSNS